MILKLYTHDQLADAFKHGRLKGQNDFTGDDGNHPSFFEYAKVVEGIDIHEEVFDEVVNKSGRRIRSEQMNLTVRAIVSAMSRATNEDEESIGISYNDLVGCSLIRK